MTPEALEKILRKQGRLWPGLSVRDAENLLTLARNITAMDTEPRAKFWGLTDTAVPWRASGAVIHCFNHSTTAAQFPWNAEAVGPGQRFPLRLAASGTILAKKEDRSPWHALDAAFLVFQVAPGADSARALERIEPGLLLTQPGTARLRSRIRVVLPKGVRPGRWSGPVEVALRNWMMGEVPARVEVLQPQDILTAGGVVAGVHCLALSLEIPIVADPGWILAFHPSGSPNALIHAVVMDGMPDH